MKLSALTCLTEGINLLLLCIIFQPQVNGDVVKWLSRTAQGFLAPLAAAVGGVASQEVLKAVTGKFSPLQQWVRLSLVLDLYFDSDFMNVWLCVNAV